MNISSINPHAEAKKRISDALINMVCEASDDRINALVVAFDGLKVEAPRIYQSLLGQTLLNDLILAVDDEFEYRQPQAIVR